MIITINCNNNNNELQRRFLINGKFENTSLWNVPISYTTSEERAFDDTKPKIFLRNESEIEFTLETDSWYLLNLMQTGSYTFELF